MDFKFSKHALERIEARHLDKKNLLSVLNDPDAIVTKTGCKIIYQKKIQEEDSKYLYRIFVNICKDPNLVITAYKTSKIDKYEH
jgi:hypothetical protein